MTMRQAFCLAASLVAANVAFAFPSWEAVGVGSHDVDWSPGGTGTLAVAGTFGSTIVTFFWCAPLTGDEECFEVNAAACTFSARGTCDFFRGPGRLRLVVTGGSPSINAVAAGPTQATVGVGGSGGVSGLLDGPVTFGGSSGALAQNPLFAYDDSVGKLRLEGLFVVLLSGTEASPIGEEVALIVQSDGSTDASVAINLVSAGTGTGNSQLNFGASSDQFQGRFIYRPALSDLRTFTDGTLRTTLNATGLGISVSPDTRLDIGPGAITFSEMTPPPAPDANGAALFVEDDGGHDDEQHHGGGDADQRPVACREFE